MNYHALIESIVAMRTARIVPPPCPPPPRGAGTSCPPSSELFAGRPQKWLKNHNASSGFCVGEAARAPSPLMGEGWGEGERLALSPHPVPLPQGAREPAAYFVANCSLTTHRNV